MSFETKVYLDVTTACAFHAGTQQDVLARARTDAAGVPLIEYAIGSCTHDEVETLARVMEHEPRFVDAAYPLGRYLSHVQLGYGQNQDAADLLARAREAFPDSAAIVYTEAALRRDRRQWVEALADFDATLRLVPTHHDARLGRTAALSNLGRHDEAIATATALINEGTWFVGDAYYWRAWNEFHLDRLDSSEQDIERAKALISSSSVFVLSGLVQWRKQRPVAAEGEFVRAVGIAADDCDAWSFLGGVRAELRKWALAGDAFASGEECRDRETVALRQSLETLAARRAPAAAIENQRRSISVSEQQSAEMAYNQGVMSANAADLAAARRHLERASRHPSLQQKASELLQRLLPQHP